MTGRLMAFLAIGSLLIVLCCGCGAGQPKTNAASTPPPPRPAFEELLKETRAELNRRAEDALAEIRTRDEARRKNKLDFKLLPQIYQPIVVPGFHELRYHPDLGYSLPTYIDPRDTVPQPDLARLYAQYGDLESASKVARGKAPADLDQLKLEKHYPVEWTRYVTYRLHGLAQKIALGDNDALAEFLDARKGLENTLGAKDSKSLLGRGLLACERRVIQAAADAWQQKGTTELANQALAALGSWPEQPPTLPFDDSRETWARLLHGAPEGQVLSGIPAVRALDFLQLPIPPDALDAVLLFFSPEGKLNDVIVTYNARIQDYCPRAPELAGALTDYVPADPAATPSRSKQVFNGWTVETRVSPVDSTVGAWVRFSRQRPLQALVVPRDFGPLHLDWSFETSRLALAPTVLGSPLTLSDDAALKRVPNPLPAGKLQDAILVKTPEHNLLEEARFRYRPGTPWHQLALPLFALLGPGTWTNEAGGATYGPRLQLGWEDETTHLALYIPHEAREPATLVLRDRLDSSHAPARIAAVKACEAKERQERIAASKALQRLPRKLDYLPLDADRDAVLRSLPKGQTVFKREFDGGMFCVVNTPPPREGPPYMVRQILIRFGKDDKVQWARIRYDVAAKPKNPKETDWSKQLLENWLRPGGKVSPLPSPYTARVADLPRQGSPGVFYHWEDDLTEASFLSDRSGVEITLEDRTHSGADELPPLSYLTRGPSEGLAGLKLGIDRKDFEAAAKTKPVESPDGAWVVGVPQGLFDALLVWFDKDNKANHIAARFRQADASKTSQKDMEKALSDRWGAEIRTVGWPARRDYSPQGTLQSMSWFDDLTRYRLYWADSDNSPARLWAEWKAEK